MTERIGYNPYFYSYPQYLSNNLGVSNTNRITPNFRGDGVASPQTSMNYTTPPDTVEISAGNKINEASTQEKLKTGMSTGTKIGLGILGTAATVYGCVVGHRMINKPSIEKVAKNFSEIFRKEVSADEAQKMVKNYDELLKIKDKDEFCKKAFEQVKKDYGYEKLDLPLIFKNEKTNAAAAFNHTDGCIYLYNREMKSNKFILENLIHEFKHVQQAEYGYRTSIEKLLDAAHKRNGRHVIASIIENEEKLAEVAKLNNKTPQEYKEELLKFAKNEDNFIDIRKNGKEGFDRNKQKEVYDRLFSSLSPFKLDSENYKQGLKYIDARAKYIPPEIDEVLYKNNLLEKDAYATGDKLKEIYNHFANPWRIF